MLTNTKCLNTKPADKVQKLTDAGGLYLEIKPSGSKLWRYRYRIGGKENVFALGSYPEVSLKEARCGRDDARELVKRGIHPAHQRRLNKLARADEMASTFEAVALAWIEENRDSWTGRYATTVRRRLEADAFPDLGRIPVKDVAPGHVLGVLKKVNERSPAQAKLLQTWIGGAFRYAVANLLRTDDPTWPLRRSVKRTQVRHHGHLEGRGEIGKFLRALDGVAGDVSTRCATLFMWLTAARVNEVVGARWEEISIDGREWRIPAERMKGKRPHVVPLSDQAVALIEVMRAFSGSLEHVFPHRSERKRAMSSEAIRDIFRRAGYDGSFTPHGVRATFSTHFNGLRADSRVVELCLAHHERNRIKASYDHAQLLPERRALLQEWAEFLDDAKAGAEVVPLKLAG
jgi:integrase